MTGLYPLRVPIVCTGCDARVTEVVRDTFVATFMHCPDCGVDWTVPVKATDPDVTPVPAYQFDRLVAAMDKPTHPNDALRDAFRHARTVVHHAREGI